jgi:hypothetical protein
MVADDTETVPPLLIVEAKFKLPDPTAASSSAVTVETAPLAALLTLADWGVPDANPSADVIADNVNNPATAAPAMGLVIDRLASLVPGSALNTPAVFPAGAPEKISRKPVVPASVTTAAMRVFLTLSLYEIAMMCSLS